MKSYNYQLDLMIPRQINKDIIFNELVLKLDSMLNITITDFSPTNPQNLTAYEKYIITTGEYKNCICYRSSETKDYQYLLPYEGMLVFLLSKSSFFIYKGDSWQAIAPEKHLAPLSFDSLQDTYTPDNNNILYLYLNGNSKIDLSKITNHEVTFIIKQNYSQSFTLEWPYNILWPQKKPHLMTATLNSMDIVKFYRLPETDHFLGQIISQNYQF